jgi:hypothetical protein
MDNGDLKISIDLDSLTIGDLERLESGKITEILKVFDHTVTVNGNQDYRDLHYMTLQAIAKAIRESVEAQSNPVVDGKN